MRSRAPSPASKTLLAVLMQQSRAQRYGYELMKATGLESGTLYPILARLHDRGLVEADWRPSVGGRPPRCAYRLTATGLAYAAEHVSPKPASVTRSKRKPA